MGTNRLALLIIGVSVGLLSALNLNASASDEGNTTLGVTVTLAGGTVDRFAIQNEASKAKSTPMIPLKGSNGVLGIRVEPYLSEGLVAVRLSALVGESSSAANGSCLRKAGAVKSVAIGSYVIGKQGDFLQIADLAKFGLAPVTVSAARVRVLPVSGGDPCCYTSQGIACCWSCSGCKTQQCFDECLQQEQECENACDN
jgi:hypothetical protein